MANVGFLRLFGKIHGANFFFIAGQKDIVLRIRNGDSIFRRSPDLFGKLVISVLIQLILHEIERILQGLRYRLQQLLIADQIFFRFQRQLIKCTNKREDTTPSLVIGGNGTRQFGLFPHARIDIKIVLQLIISQLLRIRQTVVVDRVQFRLQFLLSLRFILFICDPEVVDRVVRQFVACETIILRTLHRRHRQIIVISDAVFQDLLFEFGKHFRRIAVRIRKHQFLLGRGFFRRRFLRCGFLRRGFHGRRHNRRRLNSRRLRRYRRSRRGIFCLFRFCACSIGRFCGQCGLFDRRLCVLLSAACERANQQCHTQGCRPDLIHPFPHTFLRLLPAIQGAMPRGLFSEEIFLYDVKGCRADAHIFPMHLLHIQIRRMLLFILLDQFLRLMRSEGVWKNRTR